jgi:hypothetical protein
MLPRRRPNSDRSSESLEARLLDLPKPPVPGDLEARILAAIPARSAAHQTPRLRASALRRRFVLWASASIAAAAACLLAVRFWPEPGDRNNSQKVAVKPSRTGAGQQFTHRQPGEALWTTPLLKAGQELEETEIPTFSWPVQEKSPLLVSTAVTRDLLD